MQSAPNAPNTKNLLIALVMTVAIMGVWEYFYAMPKREEAMRYNAEHPKQAAAGITTPQGTAPAASVLKERGVALAEDRRIPIESPDLQGSLRLRGARFDDLMLTRYRETIEPNSSEVVLLAPSDSEHGYFAEIGWANKDGIRIPDSNTAWQADKNRIAPGQPLTLRWDNGQGLVFKLIITLDDQYMFTIAQQVENQSGQAVALAPYALINRNYAVDHKSNVIMHEGPLGMIDGELQEISYEKLKEDKSVPFAHQAPSTGGDEWVGITDKYWLTALVPSGNFSSNFSYYQDGNKDRYQVDYLYAAQQVQPGAVFDHNVRFYAGAKEIDVLDGYAKGYEGADAIVLFDRSVDFGVLYFMTKPIFLLLNYFYSHLGNFGLAILLLTVLLKLLMFPLANKSYTAMSQMKRLQPEMTKLRERYAEDRTKMNQEIMEMYRREKVNPMSGCLPMLIQLPVFFALYKVLFVTIEMRHAPFYGWVHDLSAIDPTNVFTLFGLMPWNAPSMLHIGLWPLIMTVTMIIQQKLNPQPTDPIQAKMMGLLPYVFLFLFASFPAGLVIYWAWSNFLSILQQWFITRRHRAAS